MNKIYLNILIYSFFLRYMIRRLKKINHYYYYIGILVNIIDYYIYFHFINFFW